MLSAKQKWNISRILPFGVIWFLGGCVFLTIEHAAITEHGAMPTSAITLTPVIFLFASIAVFLAGLLAGTFEVLYLDKKLNQFSFLRKLIYKVIIYALLFSLIILITFPIAASIELGTGIFSEPVWNKYFSFFTSITHFSTMFQLTISLVLSLLYLEINDYMGDGAMKNFFTGKYHRPREEKHVFMFLDMRASTTIAEQLGHIRYFQLLKDYYDSLAAAVIRHSGSVYQYVGDEMIITWPYESGIQNSTSIACFFAMKDDLENRAEQFQAKYGIAPTFKAGLHCGKVTTGEIGVVKKEILYTGDVLNATARIQGLCNEYDVDLLISDDLVQDLPDGQNGYSSIGEIKLKGRKQPMQLWTVR